MRESVRSVFDNTDLSQTKSLNEIIYEAFRTTIIQGKIPYGERINEKEYAVALNISRTPIRYALKQLEKEGLVDYIPKFGVVVKQITKKDAIEIYAVRKALENLATATAMQLMSEEEFQELDDLLTLTEEKNSEGKIEEVIQLFDNFHSVIYQKSNALRLKEVVANMHEYLSQFRNMCLNTTSRRNQAIIEHRELYKAMRAKNEDQVKEVIEEHLNHSLSFILKEIEKNEENLKLR